LYSFCKIKLIILDIFFNFIIYSFEHEVTWLDVSMQKSYLMNLLNNG